MMKVFAAADKDGDGVLTAEEYKTAFHEHGLHVGTIHIYQCSVIFAYFIQMKSG